MSRLRRYFATKKPIATTPAPFYLSTSPNSFGSLFDNDELA